MLPSLTILALIVIPFLLPEHLRSWTFVVLGGLETALLIAIVIVDPGRIDAVGALVRGLSIALTLLLVAAATLATVTVVVSSTALRSSSRPVPFWPRDSSCG